MAPCSDISKIDQLLGRKKVANDKFRNLEVRMQACHVLRCVWCTLQRQHVVGAMDKR